MDKLTAERMNYSPKYGAGWITNLNNVTGQVKLYPTGEASIQGRIYIALPADKILTNSDKLKYNIN